MEFKKIDSVKIPVLGIGTWGVGGWLYADYSHDNEHVKAIRTAIKLGMTHIDTAEVYGNGHAEEIVGKAVKGFDRKKLFITSKVYKNHLHYNDVINAAKNSLKRMKTGYIDLYLIHWPNPKVPLKETIKALDCLVEKKLVRFIGVSNFPLRLLKEAQSYSKNKIVANQVEYNLVKREPENCLLDYCQKNGILLVAYQPLAGGKLAQQGFKFLDELSIKYNKTRAQIAINWLISKPNVITIPKESAQHAKENLGAIGWKLNEGDSEKLERYFWKFWFFSYFIGKPVRFLRDTAVRVIPENSAGRVEIFYDEFLRKLKKAMKIFVR